MSINYGEINEAIVFDIEIYRNYSLFSFLNINNHNKRIEIELRDKEVLTKENIDTIKYIFNERLSISFNGINYDIPIIDYALMGKNPKELFDLSSAIINNGKKSKEGQVPIWVTLKNFGVIWRSAPNNHIDIMKIPLGQCGLKVYGGRLGSRTLKDLPYDPSDLLTREEQNNLKLYCRNDLMTTIDLLEAIREQVKLRYDMSVKYNINLMSKGDAQIAEKVLHNELQKKIDVYKPEKETMSKILKYKKPKFIKFTTTELQLLLIDIQNRDFCIDSKGKVKLTLDEEESKKKESDTIKKIDINGLTIKIALGGLHSQEKKRVVVANENDMIVDKDVVSYYPSIIVNNNVYPAHIPEYFVETYKDLMDKRIEAKKKGDKTTSDSLKIVINSIFGKFSDPYSIFYSPQCHIDVVITGQLSLLMLIEDLAENGIKVISANTDGIVSHLKREDYDLFNKICSLWEKETGFTLEETNYSAIYSENVNSYLAITDGGYKTKGIFNMNTLTKSRDYDIAKIAVINYLTDGIPIEETIKNCKDIKLFFAIGKVKAGATFKGEYLGTVFRCVYSKRGDVLLSKDGVKVRDTDGAIPVMTYDETEEFMKSLELDYDRYISISNKILEKIGYINTQIHKYTNT